MQVEVLNKGPSWAFRKFELCYFIFKVLFREVLKRLKSAFRLLHFYDIRYI